MYRMRLSVFRMYTCAALTGFPAVTEPVMVAIPVKPPAAAGRGAGVCPGAARPLTWNIAADARRMTANAIASRLIARVRAWFIVATLIALLLYKQSTADTALIIAPATDAAT